MIDECLPFTTAKSEPFLYLSACCTLYYPPQMPFLFSSLLYVLFSQGGLILPMEPNGYMKEETKRMNGGGGGVAESELDPWTAWAYKPRTISLLLIGACLLMWLPLSLLCFSSPLCVTHNPHVCYFFFVFWIELVGQVELLILRALLLKILSHLLKGSLFLCFYFYFHLNLLLLTLYYVFFY